MVILSMRYFKLTVLSLTILFSGFSYAETTLDAEEISTDSEIGFISDEFYVPLRSSPCPTCKIVHKGLKAEPSYLFMSMREDWSLVATEGGYRGWIRSQHLTKNKIARSILAKKIK